MLARLLAFRSDTRGATAVEYGLVLSLIVIVLLVALSNVAGANFDIWSNVAYKVTRA